MQTLLQQLMHAGVPAFKRVLLEGGIDVNSFRELSLHSHKPPAGAKRQRERSRLGRVPGCRNAPDIFGKHPFTARLHDSPPAPHP